MQHKAVPASKTHVKASDRTAKTSDRKNDGATGEYSESPAHRNRSCASGTDNQPNCIQSRAVLILLAKPCRFRIVDDPHAGATQTHRPYRCRHLDARASGSEQDLALWLMTGRDRASLDRPPERPVGNRSSRLTPFRNSIVPQRALLNITFDNSPCFKSIISSSSNIKYVFKRDRGKTRVQKSRCLIILDTIILCF